MTRATDLPPVRLPFAMQLGESFRYVFRSKSWLGDLLAGSTLSLIDVVTRVFGAMAFDGYVCEVAEQLHRRHGRWHPGFRWDRLMPYALRGLGGLAWRVISGMVATPVVVAAVAAGWFGYQGDMATAIPCGVVASIGAVVWIGVKAIACPLSLRSGMANSVGEAFRLAWGWDFVRRTWPELFLAVAVDVGAGIVLTPLGLVLCLVGSLPVAAYQRMLWGHLMYQAYRVYLSRGGDPIPLGRS